MVEMYDKWIFVRFQIDNDNELSKEDIWNMAKDMACIVNDTRVMLDLTNRLVLDYINPYLGRNKYYFLTPSGSKFDKKVEQGLIRELCISRLFYPFIEKINPGWRITLVPLKNPDANKPEADLYSLENLYIDRWCLVQANRLLIEKYNIGVRKLSKEVKPLFEAFMKNNVPGLRLFEELLITEYSVANRIKYAKKNPQMDSDTLTGSVSEYFDKVSKKAPNLEWVKAVKKLLKNK